MPLEIRPAKTIDDINRVSALAQEIWTDHFTSIIGQAQVEYMLDQFQSSQAIESQIENGYEYYLAGIENRYVGYVALVPDSKNQKMMISKLYTLASVRGSGVGSALLSYAKEKCISEKFSTLWLTVNKHNSSTISWYKRRGFRITEEIKVDISSGFYMDDYVMENASKVLL